MKMEMGQVFSHQMDCILNLDETDGALDNTTGQQGERLLFVFYSSDMAGGGSRGNKIYYSPTIITRLTAAGDPLLLHSQLKTMA